MNVSSWPHLGSRALIEGMTAFGVRADVEVGRERDGDVAIDQKATFGLIGSKANGRYFSLAAAR